MDNKGISRFVENLFVVDLSQQLIHNTNFEIDIVLKSKVLS